MSDPVEQPTARSAFAHASEAEFARILDFYQVEWAYEPHIYPILWDLEGKVLESFAPDFYLPELDLYVEMTTLRQQLVRKKNRKLRRLRELYPDIRIKLFYARDFRALLLKYGRVALADALSGTTGQVVPIARAAGIQSLAGSKAASVGDSPDGEDVPAWADLPEGADENRAERAAPADSRVRAARRTRASRRRARRLATAPSTVTDAATRFSA